MPWLGAAAVWHGAPAGASPVLLSSPHSGVVMPAAARAYLAVGEEVWREIEDAHVDALLLPAVRAHGLSLLAATHARAYCDLNRAEDEVAAGLFGGEGPLPRLTDAVRAGHGLIPTAIGGRAVHNGPLPAGEWHRRLDAVHRPFHAALDEALRLSAARWGSALLIDCHSMPGGAALHDVVLGDLHGTSAERWLVDALAGLLADQGLTVTRNQPYAGGHVTRRHAAPHLGRHVIQLELARPLYMDEARRALHAGFAPLASALARAFGALAQAWWAQAQAAE